MRLVTARARLVGTERRLRLENDDRVGFIGKYFTSFHSAGSTMALPLDRNKIRNKSNNVNSNKEVYSECRTHAFRQASNEGVPALKLGFPGIEMFRRSTDPIPNLEVCCDFFFKCKAAASPARVADLLWSRTSLVERHLH
jgi:hypothetical protein